ncbi:hypothetical protein Tco_0321552 [Tanacetum coccineum]
METQKPLLKDEDGEEVDIHLYRSMICSLMYLTSSRPDIMFAVCASARYQVSPKVSHLHAVKRIFRYLKGQPKLGLWYPKDLPFDLVAYTDSDYAGASLDRKSTTGGCQFLGCRLISWQCKKQTLVANSTTKAEYVAASSCCGQELWIQNQLLDYGVLRDYLYTVLQSKPVQDISNKFGDFDFSFASLKYLFTSPWGSLLALKMLSKKSETVNTEVQLQALVDGKKVIVTESSVRRDLQLEDVEDEAVNEEMDDNLVRATTTASSLEAEQDSGNIAKTQSKATLNEPSSIRTSLGSGPRRQETMVDTIAQTSMQLKELMDLCTNLQNRVLTLETTKTTQALEIDNLKRRVKKLEKKDSKRTPKHKSLYKVGLSAKVVSSDDEGLGEEDASKQRRKSHDIDADEDITLASTHFDADTNMFRVHDLDVVAAKDVNLSVDEVTLAQALAALKSVKPKATTTPTKTTAATTITPTSTRPRAKGIVFHDQEQAPTPTPIVSSQQPSQDKGKGKMVKEEPVKKFSKKDQLKLDEEFAFKLQAEEEEERLAREKAQKVQEDNIAWDDIQAKIKTDYELAQRLQQEEQEELTIEEKSKLFQQLLEKRRKHFAAKRLKESRRRARTREGKEKKREDDQEEVEMKKLMEIVPDEEEVAVDAIPLATKPLSIVD